MTDEPESFDELSAAQNRAAQQASDASAAKHAQRAMNSAKDFIAGANLDDVAPVLPKRPRNLYRGGRELLADNEDLSKAADNLSAAVRKKVLCRGWYRVFSWASPRALHSRLGGMRNDIVGLLQLSAKQKAQTAAKHIPVPAAFGLVAAVFFLVAVIALFAPLFLSLTSLYDQTTAAFIVAAVALALGLMALLPIVVRRQPAPPPPAPNPPQFASLLAQTAPALALKRPLLFALLLARSE